MAERLGTTALRRVWSPACTGPFATLTLHSGARISIDRRTAWVWEWVDRIMKGHGYAPRKADTGAYNCRKITGGSNYSLHAYGIAVDYNWQTNPYGKKLITDMPDQMIADILGIRAADGTRVLRWGGNYSSNKDGMHYEIVVAPSVIALGPWVEPEPEPEPTVEEVMAYLTENLNEEEQKFLVEFTKALLGGDAQPSSFAFILSRYRKGRDAFNEDKTEGDVLKALFT